jgi:hypothetical protein
VAYSTGPCPYGPYPSGLHRATGPVQLHKTSAGRWPGAKSRMERARAALQDAEFRDASQGHIGADRLWSIASPAATFTGACLGGAGRAPAEKRNHGVWVPGTADPCGTGWIPPADPLMVPKCLGPQAGHRVLHALRPPCSVLIDSKYTNI